MATLTSGRSIYTYLSNLVKFSDHCKGNKRRETHFWKSHVLASLTVAKEKEKEWVLNFCAKFNPKRLEIAENLEAEKCNL